MIITFWRLRRVFSRWRPSGEYGWWSASGELRWLVVNELDWRQSLDTRYRLEKLKVGDERS